MPQNTRQHITQRREAIAKLVVQGYTQKEMAAHLSVSQSQISLDLKIIHQQLSRAAQMMQQQQKQQLIFTKPVMLRKPKRLTIIIDFII